MNWKTNLTQRHIENAQSIVDELLYLLRNKPSDLVIGGQILMISGAFFSLIVTGIVLSFYYPIFWELIPNLFTVLFLAPAISLMLFEFLYQLSKIKKLLKFKKILHKCKIKKTNNLIEDFLTKQFFETKAKHEQKINKSIRISEYRRILCHVNGIKDLRHESYNTKDRYNFIKSFFFHSIIKLYKGKYQGIRMVKYSYHVIVFIVAFIIVKIGYRFESNFSLVLYVWADVSRENNTEEIENSSIRNVKQRNTNKGKKLGLISKGPGRKPAIEEGNSEHILALKNVSLSIKVGKKEAVNSKTQFWDELAIRLKDYGIYIKGDTIRQHYSHLLPSDVIEKLNKLN